MTLTGLPLKGIIPSIGCAQAPYWSWFGEHKRMDTTLMLIFRTQLGVHPSRLPKETHPLCGILLKGCGEGRNEDRRRVEDSRHLIQSGRPRAAPVVEDVCGRLL